MGNLPCEEFANYKAHLFYYISPKIKELLHLENGDVCEIEMPPYIVKHEEFARAMMKIGYCQAVVIFGLRGFRRLNIPQIILGNYRYVPYMVGSEYNTISPPHPFAQHEIKIMHTAYKNLKFITAKIRLFANTGYAQFGPPFYETVVGAPLLPDTQFCKFPIRKYSSDTMKIINLFPLV